MIIMHDVNNAKGQVPGFTLWILLSLFITIKNSSFGITTLL